MWAEHAPKGSGTVELGRLDMTHTSTARRGWERTVELRANLNGHFETRVMINGRPVDTMVDTGATVVALSYEDARAAGIFVGPADYTQRVRTANGDARVASVMLDTVSIDEITVRNVAAVVSEPGTKHPTLLGMSFLSRLSKTEMSRGLLTLQQD